MRRTTPMIAALLLALVLGGCTKCGGWDKFNLPYGATGCGESAPK